MSPDKNPISRGGFFRRVAALALLSTIRPADAFAKVKPFKHPDPRPGITSENVLAEDKLPKSASVRNAYAAARAHPEIFDGLACACGCYEEHRSLLTCYETMQPTGCLGCRELATLVAGEIAKGKSLAEIRETYNKKFL
jgi:hypothetical protein